MLSWGVRALLVAYRRVLACLPIELLPCQECFYAKQSFEYLLRTSQVHRFTNSQAFFTGVNLDNLSMAGGEGSPTTPTPRRDVVSKALVSAITLPGSQFCSADFTCVHEAPPKPVLALEKALSGHLVEHHV